MAHLHVSDLVQIVPAAARLESVGGDVAERLRTGIVELLAESCDLATLSGARSRLLQRVGEQQELRDAETRLVDDAIHAATMRLMASLETRGTDVNGFATQPPAISA